MIHQIDSKNEWLLLPVSFTAKFMLVFVLSLENTFSERFHFNANRKSIGSSKTGTRDFQNSTPFERSAYFAVTVSKDFKRFQYFNFEADFVENENFFLKKHEYNFLVESTKIENASFPYKTAISEANGKTNSMGTTKWNTEQMDHKEQSFSSNYLIFF